MLSSIGSYQSGWEDHRMEWNIIFAHELIHINVMISLFPPFLISWISLTGNTDVTNRSIKPDIEHFVLILFQWYWCPPFQVSSDTPLLQSLLQPCIRNIPSIGCPIAFQLLFFDELFQMGL